MSLTEGASVTASPVANPELAPPAPIAPPVETQAVTVPALEPGSFMIPGDPDSYSLGPTATNTIEAPAAPIVQEQPSEAAPPSFDAITRPAVTEGPETMIMTGAPTLTQETAAPPVTQTITQTEPIAGKPKVTIEHVSKPRNDVREIRPATVSAVLHEKMTTHFPAELEELVGKNVEKAAKPEKKG